MTLVILGSFVIRIQRFKKNNINRFGRKCLMLNIFKRSFNYMLTNFKNIDSLCKNVFKVYFKTSCSLETIITSNVNKHKQKTHGICY